MRLAGLTVGVDGDLTPLQNTLSRGKDVAVQGGNAIGDAIGQGISKASQYLQQTEKDVESWASRHKGLLLGVAATAGSIYTYQNFDQVKQYWDMTSDAASKATDQIKESLRGAESGLKDFKGQVADVATDMVNRFGTAGSEAGKYFTSKLLEGLGDAALKMGQKAVDIGAEFDRLSHYTGQSVQSLSSLDQVAKQTGVSFSGLQADFKALQAATEGQTDAAKLARDQLAAIGISVKDNSGQLKTSQALWIELSEVIRGFGDKGEDASKKIGVLKNVLGSIDKDKLDLLNEGGQANSARLEEAARLSLIYTDQMAEDSNRIKKIRAAETTEEAAWAQRKSDLWAGLGLDLRKLSADVAYGQTSFADGIIQAWDRITKFIDDGLSYVTQKYNAFLSMTKQAISALSPDLVPAWLDRAVAAGPSPPAVAAALQGHNPDGTVSTPAVAPGSQKPPTPLSTPVTDSGSGGRDNEESIRKLVNSMAGKAIQSQQSLLGDVYGAHVAAAEKEFQQDLDNLTLRLKDFEGANKASLEAAGKYWAEYEHGIKLAQATQDQYLSSIKGTSSYLSAMAGMGKGDDDYAKKYAAWSKMEEEVTKYKGDQEKVTQAISEYEARISQIETDRTKTNAQSAVTLAQIKGDKQAELDATVKLLEAELALTNDLGQKLVLQEKINQAKASAGGSPWDAAFKGAQDYAKTIPTLFEGVSKSVTDAFKGMEDAIVSWTMSLFDGKKAAIDFASVAKSALSSVVRGVVQNGITGPLSQSLSGLLGGSSSTSSPTQTAANAVNGSTSQSSSGGGIFGNLSSFSSDSSNWISSLFGGGGSASAAEAAGVATEDVGLSAGETVSGMATSQAAETMAGSAASSGLGSLAGGAGGLIGSIGGSLLGSALAKPGGNGAQLASYGAGGGALAGMLAGAAIGSAFPVIGTAIGGLVGGIIGGLGGGAAGGLLGSAGSATVSASNQAGGMSIGGAWVPQTYDVMRSPTGSHYAQWNQPDPLAMQQAMAAQQAYYGNIDTAGARFGINADAGRAAVQTPAVPDIISKVVQKIITDNIEHGILGANYDAVASVRKSGETLDAVLSRLGQTMDTVRVGADSAGVSMQHLSGGLNGLQLAVYEQKISDIMGGADKVATALQRFVKYAFNAVDGAQRAMSMTGMSAGEGLVQLRGQGVDVANFWQKYRDAMDGAMSPEDFKKWSDAATGMASFSDSITAYISAVTSGTQSLIDSAKSYADSFAKLRNKLLADPNTTTLDAGDRYLFTQATFRQTAAAAATGDATALANMETAATDYLSAAKDALADYGLYQRTFNEVSSVVDTLQTYEQTAYEAGTLQLAVLNSQLTALTGVNAATSVTIPEALANIQSAITGAKTSAANAVAPAAASSSSGGGDNGAMMMMLMMMAMPHADGGVFDKAHFGMVAEAGTEAVIPMPNGRSVPVEMRGGSSALAALIQSLIAEVQAMREELAGAQFKLVEYARKSDNRENDYYANGRPVINVPGGVLTTKVAS